MSEVNNNKFGKSEAILEKSVDQNQTQQDNLDAMMEKLKHQTAAMKKVTAQTHIVVEPHAQSTAKGTAREEAIDRSTLKQVSEIVAGIQRDVVHGEEKVAGIVKALEETTITPVADESHTIHEEDTQKTIIQDEFQADLNKAETEFNSIEAFMQATATHLQNQERGLENLTNEFKRLAETIETGLDNLASEIQTLKASTAKGQALPTKAGSSNGDNTRVSPVTNHATCDNTRESIQTTMSPEVYERLQIVQRNMKTLILDENDELLTYCTREYGEVVIDIPSDKWITRRSDLENELRHMQRQLISARIRFKDWSYHLSQLCDNELNHAIRGEDGHLLPWPQAVCEILRDVDFRYRSFKIMDELWATWPKKGELLRPFFWKFFLRAGRVTEFSVFPLVSWRVQQILCKQWPSPLDTKKIQDLDSLRDLEAFVWCHVSGRMTYNGSHTQ